jgi:hypothetical protein
MQFLSILLGSAKRSFFLRPAIDLFAFESQQISHAGVRQRMFILASLSPLHYSRGNRITIRIDELPVTSELPNAITSFAAHSMTSAIFAFRSKSSSSMVGID